MSDLDNALRDMLRERAGDISTLPADFADLPSVDVLSGGAEHDERRRNRLLTVAAAVAIVAAVVGTAVGVKQFTDRQDSRPAASTPTRVVTPPPPGMPHSAATRMGIGHEVGLDAGCGGRELARHFHDGNRARDARLRQQARCRARDARVGPAPDLHRP